MKRQGINKTRILALGVAALALGATGCPDDPHGMPAGYCDDSGCYQCDWEKRCWPIPNEKCASDAECGTGRCTSIGCTNACASDAECQSGNVCATGYCAPAGFSKVVPFVPSTSCVDDSVCKSDEYCKSGKCAPRCKSDDDCGPDMVCTSCGKCEPKGIPATCGSAQIFCSATVGCGEGRSCVKGRCHGACTTSTTCAVGQVCNGGLCTDDASPLKPQCALDMQCQGGVCINGYCHDRCKVSSACGAGALCLMGVCQPDYNPAN